MPRPATETGIRRIRWVILHLQSGSVWIGLVPVSSFYPAAPTLAPCQKRFDSQCADCIFCLVSVFATLGKISAKIKLYLQSCTSRWNRHPIWSKKWTASVVTDICKHDVCNRNKSQCIYLIDGIVLADCVEVFSSIFFDRIAGQPAAEAGGVVAVAVVERIGFGVVVFGGEAEGGWMGCGGDQKFAEGGIVVMGEDGTGRGDVFGDVSVGVVGRVGSSRLGIRHGEEAADAAGTLEGPGQVETPEVRERVGCSGCRASF